MELPENEAQLTRTMYNGKGAFQCCNICLLDFNLHDKLIYLPCLHYYHEYCVLDWIHRSETCPDCCKRIYKEVKLEDFNS